MGLNLYRLLKNAHLQRSPHPSSLQRTSKYASLLKISGAPANGISQGSTCIRAFLTSLKKMRFSTGCLFLTLPIFHESFLLTPSFFPWKRRNIYAATLRIVDCWLLIGIYKFYEHWATETFRQILRSLHWGKLQITNYLTNANLYVPITLQRILRDMRLGFLHV